MRIDSGLLHDFAPDKPSVARMYDYFLGGYHNFAIDRRAAQKVSALYPDVPIKAQINRAFLRRAVNFLTAQGIDQFLDIGSGIPTVGNVHQIAERANPSARVVYVDIDPVAVAHSEAILQGNRNVIAIQADACHPEQILNHTSLHRLLDLGRPVGVSLVAILHFIPDDAVARYVVRRLRDAVLPGSYLVISHKTFDVARAEIIQRVEALSPRTSQLIKSRCRAEIETFFEGFELVEPGLVDAPCWRPEGADDRFLHLPERSMIVAGVGRKR